MPHLFRCPLCNAQLELANSNSSFQKCAVCENQIIVPPKLRPPAPNKLVPSGILDQGRRITTIQREISAGRKADAIKMFRETYGCDLQTAQKAVDAIERNDQATVIEMITNLNNFAEVEEPEHKLTLGGLVLWLIISAALVAVVMCLFIVLTR